MKGKRTSKSRLAVHGDLRGLSARDYYAHDRMTRNIISKCRQHLDHNVWVRLDRGKPVTQAQANAIEDALNRVAVEQPEWPFSWPHVKFGFKRVDGSGRKGRPGIAIEYVEVRRIPKKGTPDGTVYTPNTKDTVSFGGREGIVVYSKHAIEQLVDRVPELREASIRRTPAFVRDILQHVVEKAAVEQGLHGPSLAMRAESGKALGFFPLTHTEVDGKPAWVCKTFLNPGMRGLPATPGCRCDYCAGLSGLEKRAAQ